MKKNGFTLVELLATLVILGIVVGITIVSVNGSLSKAKEGTEKVFIKTLNDAISLYLDYNGNDLVYGNVPGNASCEVVKSSGNSLVKYSSINFQNIIDDGILSESDFKNPANETVRCDASTINVYRDSDYVYYYSYTLNCLSNSMQGNWLGCK